jgi:hypothetical protein
VRWTDLGTHRHDQAFRANLTALMQNTALRGWLEEHQPACAMAVPKTFTAATAAGAMRADTLARLVPARGWPAPVLRRPRPGHTLEPRRFMRAPVPWSGAPARAGTLR